MAGNRQGRNEDPRTAVRRKVRGRGYGRTRDIHAALHMEQIRAFLPLSRWWLEQRFGISEPKELTLLEADQDLAPELRKMDLLLVARSAGNKLPRWRVSMFFPCLRDLP